MTEGPQGPQARSVRPLTGHPASPARAARRSIAELDALVTEMIGLLDTTVLPELGTGRYPDQAPAKLAAQATATGGRLDQAAFWHLVRRLARAAGIEHYRCWRCPVDPRC